MCLSSTELGGVDYPVLEYECVEKRQVCTLQASACTHYALYTAQGCCCGRTGKNTTPIWREMGKDDRE